MKVVAAFLLILCFAQVRASVSYNLFEIDKLYQFEYIGHAVSGIPDVSNAQRAGLAFKCTVLVKRISEEKVYVKMEKPMTAMINEPLFSFDLENSQFQFEPVMGKYERYLISPIEVTYKQGQIERFAVDGWEPESVTNGKKGLIGMLQSSLLPQQKANYQEKSKFTYDDTEVYEVLEDGISGEQPVQYTVQSDPWPGNPMANVFNVTKVQDYEDPLRYWAMSSHPPNNCTDCDADDQDVVNTVSLCELDIAVKSKGLEIQRIECKSETVFIPLTSNADEIHTNHSQVLILVKVSEAHIPLPPLINSTYHEELRYTFPDLDEGVPPTEEDLVKRPVSFLPRDGKGYCEEAKRLIFEVAAEIAKNPNSPMVSTPFKAQRAADALATCTAEELNRILQQFPPKPQASHYTYSRLDEEKEIRRRVAIDTMLICGTLPCHSVLLDQVKMDMGQSEAVHLLKVLPFNCRRPARPLIKKVMELCKSIAVSEKDVDGLRDACWLAYASLVDKSCGSNSTNVPTTPGLESYCSDEDESEYVQALATELQNAKRKEKRLLYVYALFATGSEKIVEVLSPYIEGEVQVSEMVRVAAIHALACATDERPEEVARIVTSIAFDSNETTVVRAACLRILGRCDPDLALLQKIAALTWDDEDNQITGLIETVMDNMGNVSYPCYAEYGSYFKQAYKKLYSDIDDDDTVVGIMDSYFQILDDYDETFKLGTFLKFGLTANNQSLFPRAMYMEYDQFLGGYEHVPLSGLVQLQGMESLIKRLIGQKVAFDKLELEDIFKDTYDDEPVKDYMKLFEKLNISPRTDEPFIMSMMLQTLTSQYSHYYIDSKTIRKSIKAIMNRGKPFGELFGNGYKFSYQNIFNFGYVKYQIPSCLGFPIVVQVKSPAIVDIRGRIKINIKEHYPSTLPIPVPKVIEISLDIHPSFSLNIMTTMGVVNPMRKISAVSGVSSKTFMTFPLAAKTLIDFEHGILKESVILAKNMSDNNDLELFFYQVKPFTALYPYNSFQPIQNYSKTIYSKEKPDVYVYPFGEVLGIPGVYKIESDHFWQDKGSTWSYFFEDNSPQLLGSFWWATPVSRYRKYLLKIDGSVASRTEMTATIQIESLRSHIQEILHQGQTGPSGLLGFLLNWNKIPWQCELKPHGKTVCPLGDGDQFRQKKYSDDSFDSKGHSSSKYQSSGGGAEMEKVPINSETVGASIRARVNLGVKGGLVSRSVRSTLLLTRNKYDMKDSAKMEAQFFNPPYTSGNKLYVVANGRLEYPTLPCDYYNSRNPDSVKPIRGSAEISYDIDDSQKQRISIQSIFSKSDDQKEVEREKDSWPFDQCEEDYTNGSRISESCAEAVDRVGELKDIEVVVEYSKLPKWVLNSTHKVNNFMKYLLYSHLSVDPIHVHNTEGRLKIEAMFDADDPKIDVKIMAAHETIVYDNVYTDSISQYLYPPNARVPLIQNYLDDVTGGYAPATCKLMSRSVENFDNVTYPVTFTGCKQVLAKDCSPGDAFSVLVRKMASGKELTMYLRNEEIMVKPRFCPHNGEYLVTINNQPQLIKRNEFVALKVPSPNGRKKVIAYIAVIGELLHIGCPYDLVRVKFDGDNVEVEASNFLRGQMCGLCSEFDGYTSGAFTGPNECEYADPNDFSYSYAVRDQCSAPNPSDKKICPDDVGIESSRGGQFIPTPFWPNRGKSIYTGEEYDKDEGPGESSRGRQFIPTPFWPNRGKSIYTGEEYDEDEGPGDSSKGRERLWSWSGKSLNDDDDDYTTDSSKRKEQFWSRSEKSMNYDDDDDYTTETRPKPFFPPTKWSPRKSANNDDDDDYARGW